MNIKILLHILVFFGCMLIYGFAFSITNAPPLEALGFALLIVLGVHFQDWALTRIHKLEVDE